MFLGRSAAVSPSVPLTAVLRRHQGGTEQCVSSLHLCDGFRFYSLRPPVSSSIQQDKTKTPKTTSVTAPRGLWNRPEETVKWFLLSRPRDPFIYEADWCLRVIFPDRQAAPPFVPRSSVSSFSGDSGGRERGCGGFHVEASRGASPVWNSNGFLPHKAFPNCDTSCRADPAANPERMTSGCKPAKKRDAKALPSEA